MFELSISWSMLFNIIFLAIGIPFSILVYRHLQKFPKRKAKNKTKEESDSVAAISKESEYVELEVYNLIERYNDIVLKELSKSLKKDHPKHTKQNSYAITRAKKRSLSRLSRAKA